MSAIECLGRGSTSLSAFIYHPSNAWGRYLFAIDSLDDKFSFRQSLGPPIKVRQWSFLSPFHQHRPNFLLMWMNEKLQSISIFCNQYPCNYQALLFFKWRLSKTSVVVRHQNWTSARNVQQNTVGERPVWLLLNRIGFMKTNFCFRSKVLFAWSTSAVV